MKVAINRCHGGFDISQAAYERLITHHQVPVKAIEESTGKETSLAILSGSTRGYWVAWDPPLRTDSRLVEVIEALGEVANGPNSELRLVDIPEGSEYEIDDFDGKEMVVVPRREYF